MDARDQRRMFECRQSGAMVTFAPVGYVCESAIGSVRDPHRIV